jgi:hypothetical protein
MDFGGFFLFAFLALGLLIGGRLLVAAFVARSPWRWRGLGLWLCGFMALAIFGRYLYQIYWLDEKLFIAASQGDAAQVKALLSAGASPNATWEDGTSALSVASQTGHKDVVSLSKHAGASR